MDHLETDFDRGRHTYPEGDRIYRVQIPHTKIRTLVISTHTFHNQALGLLKRYRNWTGCTVMIVMVMPSCWGVRLTRKEVHVVSPTLTLASSRLVVSGACHIW